MIEKMSLMRQTVDKVKSLESDHVENTTAHCTKYANLMGLIMNNYGMRFLDIRNTVPRNIQLVNIIRNHAVSEKPRKEY